MYNSKISYYTVKPYDTIWELIQRYNTSIQMVTEMNPQIDLNFLQVGQVIRIRSEYNPQGCNPPTDCITKAEVNIMNVMRMLWEEHSTWTRMTIISIVFGLPDEEVVTKRLLRNPQDFANALKPYYGDMIASKFGQLLTAHLVIAAELVKAAKAGNSKGAADAEKRWYENADEIAALLGSINPYWSQESWRVMLYEHLRLVKSEAIDMLRKDYQSGVDIYDEIEIQALEMADMMVQGIIRQFPNKF